MAIYLKPELTIQRGTVMNNLLNIPARNNSGLNFNANTLKTAKRTSLVLAIAATLAISGCASKGNERAQGGAIIGGLIGAVAGAAAGDTETAVFGGIAGALIGGAVGNYQDNQQRELEQQLAAEIAAEQVEIQRLADETLQVSLSNESSFDVNSSEIKPAFQPALDRLGFLLQKYDKTAVHVIGHTDSTGTDEYNQGLSRERAVAVARYVRDAGLDQRRLNVEGRGESEPRESNDTASGRQSNRRVEIYLRPIVEGQQQQAFESPSYS